jgi:hypothetical protein
VDHPLAPGSPPADTRPMLPRKRTLVASAATCAALAIPSVASAEDFCVGGPAGCNGTPVAAGGLKAALTAAESNGTDDRFFLAPGVYSADAFAHKSPERVQIIGAGADKSILRGSLADDAVLWLEGNPDSSVSSLTVQPTAGMTAGLVLQGTRARHVSVGPYGSGFTGFGAMLHGGGTFDDGRVDIGTSSTYAVLVAYAGTVTGSTLHAPAGVGVEAIAGTATVRRSTIGAAYGGVADTSRLTIADSVITGALVGGFAAPGMGGIGTTGTVDLDRVTIVGGKFGALAQADEAGENAAVHVKDSVISSVETPVARTATNGAAAATVTTDRSAYPAPATPVNDGPGKLVETGHLTVGPNFVDEAGGDFHLAAGSPLIDAGTAGALPAGATDRDGKPRASDGNGDCAPVPDIGAFEYQGTSPAACSAAPAPPSTTGGSGPTPAPPAQVVAPSISRLRVLPGRVEIGTALPKLVSTAVARPLGEIRFRLSKRATVTLRFVKIGANKDRVHKLRIKARKGRNRIRFAARLTRTVALKPGNYQLTAVATDPAGARSKRARTRVTVIKATRR